MTHHEAIMEAMKPNKWYYIDQIARQVGITQSATGRILNNAYKFGFVDKREVMVQRYITKPGYKPYYVTVVKKQYKRVYFGEKM